jgi:hypothetical protein
MSAISPSTDVLVCQCVHLSPRDRHGSLCACNVVAGFGQPQVNGSVASGDDAVQHTVARVRRRLEVLEKPYFARVTSSIHLGYRKGSRYRDGRALADKIQYRTRVLESVPDDRLRANRSSVLSYQRAVIKR